MPQVSCPKCDKALKVPDTSTALRARCPACQHIFMIAIGPAPQAPSQPDSGKLGWPVTTALGVCAVTIIGILVYLVVATVGDRGSERRGREPDAVGVATLDKIGEAAGSAGPPAPRFSDQQTSYSRAGEIEDFSYGSVKRVSLRIVVPLGRTREELTATLDRAARQLAKETQANQVMVFAHRPQDKPSGYYSAGQAIYAPNGEWGARDPSAPMRVSVDLNELYFAPPKRQTAVGGVVRLKASGGGLVKLSKGPDSWSEKDIIARVPTGTNATVLERQSEVMGNHEFVRCRVRVIDRGREVTGWVHGENVE